jgi:spermidine/putrescine transport system permease protein
MMPGNSTAFTDGMTREPVGGLEPPPRDLAKLGAAPSHCAVMRRQTLLWLLPPLAWFFVFMIVPYGLLLYYSLGTVENVTFHPGFTAQNFVRLFTTEPYLSVLLKSLRIGIIAGIGASLFGYPLAFTLAFHVASERARFFVYLLIIAPWWAAYLVKAYAWKTILGSHGLINSALLSSGLISDPLTVLLYNEFSVCLTLIYIFTPFAALSIYASLERIPTSIIESARDLGASSWEIFTRIVWPLSVPGVVAGAIITSSLAFGDFIAPALVGGPSGIMITNIVVNLLGVAFDWPMAASIGVVTIILGMLLISIAQYFEHRGAVRL